LKQKNEFFVYYLSSLDSDNGRSVSYSSDKFPPQVNQSSYIKGYFTFKI
jgi:hypothetical protein